jgi:hypothetical protein
MIKPANPARTEPVSPSMKKIAVFVAKAIGESLWPKHTGHANAARGAATIATVRRVSRMFPYMLLVFRRNAAAYITSMPAPASDAALAAR